jgi:hypothetical protein
MLTSAQLEVRTGVAPIADTIPNRDVSQPLFSKASSLFDQLPVANDNPRSLADELAARLASAQRELSIVSMYLTPEFRAGAMRQLTNLLSPESWDEDDILLDVQSAKSFARAMAVLRPSVRPMLGLSPRGNLLAMWGSEASRLSFEHLPGDQIKWFAHSRMNEDHDVGSGATVITRIARIIDAHDLNYLLYGKG